MIVGILAVAGAATCLGIMPSIQKQLLVDGLPMNSLMFFNKHEQSFVFITFAIGKRPNPKA